MGLVGTSLFMLFGCRVGILSFVQLAMTGVTKAAIEEAVTRFNLSWQCPGSLELPCGSHYLNLNFSLY